MKGTRTRARLDTLKKRALRIHNGSEDELKALARSWLANPLHDILVRASDRAIADGTRRVIGLELLGETEADIVLIDGDPTDSDLDILAMVSAYHRAPLGGWEQASIVQSVKAARPVITNQAIADEMQIDRSMPTKLLSVFDCLPEVQEAARAGKIGVTKWYAISQSPDQLAALQAALNGSTRGDLERENRKRRNGQGNGQPPVRMPKIKIPLATETATGTVTVAGTDIDLDDAENILKEALKAVRAAREKNLDTKTAQAVWRDMAKIGG